MRRDIREEKKETKKRQKKSAKRRCSLREIERGRTPEAHYSTGEKKENAKKVLTVSVLSLIFHK
jgi:hypothetical protein